MVLSDVDVLEDPVFDDGCWSFYSILIVKIGLLQKKKIWDTKNKFGICMSLRPLLWPWLLSCLQLHFYRKKISFQQVELKITITEEWYPVELKLVYILCFYCLYTYFFHFLWPEVTIFALWCHKHCTITNKRLKSKWDRSKKWDCCPVDSHLLKQRWKKNKI